MKVSNFNLKEKSTITEQKGQNMQPSVDNLTSVWNLLKLYHPNDIGKTNLPFDVIPNHTLKFIKQYIF